MVPTTDKGSVSLATSHWSREHGFLSVRKPIPSTECSSDQMAVFADGVCCGVLHAYVFSKDDISWAGRVYDDMHQGKIYVRYYSAEQHTIYTTEATLSGAANSEVYLDFNK